MKRIFMIAVLALTTTFAGYGQSSTVATGRTYVVHIWFDGVDVQVEKIPRLEAGDRLQVVATQGDFVLTWVNPFNDNGWRVYSTQGIWTSPPVQYYGYYHFNCLLNIGGWFIQSEYGAGTPSGGGNN